MLINDVYIDVDCVSFIDSLLFIDCRFSIIFEIGKKEREFSFLFDLFKVELNVYFFFIFISFDILCMLFIVVV